MYYLTIIYGSLRKVQQFFRLSRQMLIKMLNLRLVPEHNNLSHISQNYLLMTAHETKYDCKRITTAEDTAETVIVWLYELPLWPWSWRQQTNSFAWQLEPSSSCLSPYHVWFQRQFRMYHLNKTWTDGYTDTGIQIYPPLPHREYKYVHKWCPVTACHIPPLIPHNRCPVYPNYWPVQKHWPPCLFFHICGSSMFLCTNTNSSI